MTRMGVRWLGGHIKKVAGHSSEHVRVVCLREQHRLHMEASILQHMRMVRMKGRAGGSHGA